MTIWTCILETALGHIGLAWSDRGLCGVELFDGDSATVSRSLLRRFPSAIVGDETALTGTTDIIRRYSDGERVDFQNVEVDLTRVASVDRPILLRLRRIPYGELVTYGMLAEELAAPGGARQIGQVMGRNPVPLILPCHRVVGTGGRLVGFSGHGGIAAKSRMLDFENARLQIADQLSLSF